jgi:hypothetical protein
MLQEILEKIHENNVILKMNQNILLEIAKRTIPENEFKDVILNIKASSNSSNPIDNITVTVKD